MTLAATAASGLTRPACSMLASQQLVAVQLPGSEAVCAATAWLMPALACRSRAGLRLAMGLAHRWTGCCRDDEPLLRQPPTALQPPGQAPCCCPAFSPILDSHRLAPAAGHL